jgi:hypothetical protein
MDDLVSTKPGTAIPVTTWDDYININDIVNQMSYNLGQTIDSLIGATGGVASNATSNGALTATDIKQPVSVKPLPETPKPPVQMYLLHSKRKFRTER